jgi:hypothetical protein
MKLLEALLRVNKDKPISVYTNEVEDLPQYMKDSFTEIPNLKYYWLAEYKGEYTYGDVGIRAYYLDTQLVGYSSCPWRGGYAPICWVSVEALTSVIEAAKEVCEKDEYTPPFFIEDTDEVLSSDDHTFGDTLVTLNLEKEHERRNKTDYI